MDTLRFVSEPLQHELDSVHRFILDALRAERSDLQDIDQYIFRTPGKMLRPALVFLSGIYAFDSGAGTPDGVPGSDPSPAGENGYLVDAVGNENARRLRDLAVVVELLHNASLLHDDVLDESATRRRLPTLNAVHGDRIAVLAGDVLFSRAFGILARSFEPEITGPITEVTASMCHGEMLAALFDGRRIPLDDYREIIRLKTAEFAGVCCRVGALSVGNRAFAEELSSFGLWFGAAYQILDDAADGDGGQVDGFSVRLADGYIEQARDALTALPARQSKSQLLRFFGAVVDAARDRG